MAARRPLALAFALGCAISLMASGTLTLRLALPATLYWSFVPLVELAGLAVALRGRCDAETIDAFFAGHGPWLLWLAAFAAMWGLVPAQAAYGRGSGYPALWYAAGALAAGWSAWIDLGFFRAVRAVPGGGAARDVVVQRLVAWPLGMAIFVAPGAWQVVVSRLGW